MRPGVPPWRAPWFWISVASAAVLFWQIKDYGFLGQDTYSLLLSCRLRSAGDVPGVLLERLMGTHNLYRPLFNLSLAVDQALFGLDAVPYHLVDALFFALCAWATGLLAQRLAGEGSRVAPLVATVAFVFFPQHFEVLPVVSRRPEMMAWAFLALAIWFQLSERALQGRWPPITPALFGLLAMGSKDNGVLVVPACFAAVWMYSPRSGWLARAQHAVVAMIPHAVVGAVYWAGRSVAVTGIGGQRGRDHMRALLGYPQELGGMLDALLRPEPLVSPSPITPWLSGAMLAAVVLSGLMAARVRRTDPGARVGGSAGRAAAFAIGLLAAFTIVYAARGVWRSWYVFLLVGPWALFLGAAGAGLAGAVRRETGAARAVAAAGLALLAASIGWNARYSPIAHRYDDWADQAAALEGFYGELERRIASAPEDDGRRLVEVPPFPPHLGVPPEDRAFVHRVRNVTPRSVKAWCELAEPDRRVRLTHTSQARLRPSDELVLSSDEFSIRERPRRR